MRRAVYYWKCDRPAALHGVRRPAEARQEPMGLRELLADEFGSDLRLHPAGGQGNHLTFRLEAADGVWFVRVEDGPEGDDYLRVESRILEAVGRTGVPVPRSRFTDVSRRRIPHSIQVIDYLDYPDLGALQRQGKWVPMDVAEEIGRAVATWQSVPVRGFGPINPRSLDAEGDMFGWHDSYASYFQLNLDRHLARLAAGEFLSLAEIGRITRVLEDHHELLAMAEGCLVHKDLALWNILGTVEEIRAFIDWDDAISGDPTDDLSLLGCFYSADVMEKAISGYVSVRSLPENFRRRFWLHLIRNLIVKAVIRCEAGYFQQGPGTAFLMGVGQDGEALRQFTRKRLFRACRGLVEDRPLADLDL